MATSSFDKHFKVQGTAANKFLKDLNSCRTTVTFKRKDINAESKRGVEILKRRLSN